MGWLVNWAIRVDASILVPFGVRFLNIPMTITPFCRTESGLPWTIYDTFFALADYWKSFIGALLVFVFFLCVNFGPAYGFCGPSAPVCEPKAHNLRTHLMFALIGSNSGGGWFDERQIQAINGNDLSAFRTIAMPVGWGLWTTNLLFSNIKILLWPFDLFVQIEHIFHDTHKFVYLRSLYCTRARADSLANILTFSFRWDLSK